MFTGDNKRHCVLRRETEEEEEECISDLLRMEFGKHDTGGTHPEWAQQLVNDAMNVVERQGVQDDIISGPRPF